MTFVIEGIEASKALTTSLNPSFLLITLSGLKALSALKAFKDFKALPPAVEPERVTYKSTIDAETTKKSSAFQADLM